MKRGSLADFLVRTVLDNAFRELAIANPQRAFEGYELSEQEKDILRRRDHRLLGLLGEVVAHKGASAEQPLQKERTDPTGPTLPSLPEVKLLLRLAPHVPQSPGSEANVSYAASLHPWPCKEQLETDSDGGEQPKGQTGAAVGEVSWIIRITPNVVESREAGLTVAYSASIHHMTADSDQVAPSLCEPTQELASPPWNHHVESAVAKTAAQAVQAAEPGERYGKLLELVHALQTGDSGD